jgi:hypothetical protein
MPSLTARSTVFLREQGYIVATVEHYNAFTKRKHDLFGCIDLLAIGNGETVAVQVTSKGLSQNVGTRSRRPRLILRCLDQVGASSCMVGTKRQTAGN